MSPRIASFLATLLVSTACWALPPGFVLEEVATGLDQPVALAFAPDSTVFVAERATGMVRAITRSGLSPRPVLRVPVSSSGERGLLGLAVHPDFASNGYLYLFHTRRPTLQRISRFTIEKLRGGEETVILDGIPAAAIHNGGGLHFGPDGHLYFSVGDTGTPELATKLDQFPGKLHRIAADGSIPEDNPWPDRSAYCLGLRNVFDFDFLPGQLPVVVFATENGPTTDDEVNRILAGADCGWPLGTGSLEDPRLTNPLLSWSPTTAPVGIACYQRGLFPADYAPSLFFAEYCTGRIRRLQLDASATRVVSQELFLDKELGPLFALAVGGDGALWFTSSTSVYRIGHSDPPRRFVRGNIDGRGGITPTDAVTLLAYVVAQGPEPECLAAADVNADGRVDVTDVSDLLAYVFGAIPRLHEPFPHCGLDPVGLLDCQRFPPCQ